MKATTLPIIAMFAALLLVNGSAKANQDSMGFEDSEEVNETEPTDDQNADEEDMFLAGEETEEEKMLAPPVEQVDAGRAEDPSKPYFSVGPRIRWIMMPTWFISMFGVDIKTPDNRHLLVSNPGIGAEFTYRKDGFDITAALWWAGLGWDGTVAFKDKSDPPNSWEVVRNDLNTLLVTVDFIWSTSFTDWFAITYGAGLGLGIPIKGLERNEIASENNSGYFNECDGETPSENDWCGPGEEYDEEYPLPTGIVPWINFLFGLRFKPHRHVAIYADAGFGVGFQMGLRGGYIF